MTLALNVAAALMAGLFLTRLGNKLSLPDVTCYLVAGLLLGPCFIGSLQIPGFGFHSFEDVGTLNPFCDVALGFIAFAIGSEFRLSHLKQTGHKAVIIGIFQAVFTTLTVDALLFVLYLFMPGILTLSEVLILGAIAAATAPAATLMVVRQYKAKGELTDTLLPVVALDDGVGLILFAISYGIAEHLAAGGQVNVIELIAGPFLEITVSLIAGAALGWLLTHTARMFHSNRNRVTLIVSFIILGVTVCSREYSFAGIGFSLSSLLLNMMLGTVFCNCCKKSEDLMNRADRWSAPLMMLFFVLSGAELNLFAFSNLGILAIGILYIIARCLGKYFGAKISCIWTHCSQPVKNYLGITLFPQAGVALGMAATVAERMGEQGAMLRNVVLFGVLIYELFGPSLTKWALTKAGEIKPIDKKKEMQPQVVMNES